MTNRRNGIVLLEVLCALTLLTGAGVALVRVVTTSAMATRYAAARESQLGQKARLLLVYQLMTLPELTERLGIRDVGELQVEVVRLSVDLFRVSVSARRGEVVPPLTTVVFGHA